MSTAIRRILVAVDPAQPRDPAFDQALRLARGWCAELYLIHARPSRAVRALASSAEDEGVPARVVTAQGADLARAIAAHAHLVMADLIVIPRDFGSSRVWRRPCVAAPVGRSSPVPVLIVPSRRAAPRGEGTPFAKIVVAVDFTVASAVALRVATDLIAQGTGRGTAVHALSYPSPMAFSGGEALRAIADLRGRIAQAETRLRRAMPAATSHLVKPRVVAGSADRVILDVAAEIAADLLVMGVARRDRLDEVFFGSTFRRVVSRSLRPILAVPVAAGAYEWADEHPARDVSERDLRAA